ncbi:3'(2'),5'-bisphosphate nucleotidase CysQ [Desulfosarcina cetonica]
MNDRSTWLMKAITAALAAGRSIIDVYASSQMDIEKKNDGSPLTRADRRSNEIIQAAMNELEIPILSEEGLSIPFEERRQWQRMWIVDPLDGTKEFIKRNGEFTVNIALAERGVPTMGVIYVPVTGTLYFADTRLGAFKIDNAQGIMADGMAELTQLIPKAARLPVPQNQGRPFTVMGSRSHATPELKAYVDAIREEHPGALFIPAGSSLKICRVAEGFADIYPRLGPTMEWDTAAGQAIATASGAKVVRHDDGSPLTYNKPELLNPWFIVKR